MVRFCLADVLKARKMTAYQFAKEVEDGGGELTVRAAYRLARPGFVVRRLDLDTLDVLCRVLDVTPGDLLEYRAERRASR